MSEQRGHDENCPLVNILAAMLRSVMAWEQAHGGPPEHHESGPADVLTRIPSAYTLATHHIDIGGQNNDDCNADQEYRSPDNL